MLLCFPHSGESLESLDSLEMEIFEKTPFPKDPCFRSRFRRQNTSFRRVQPLRVHPTSMDDAISNLSKHISLARPPLQIVAVRKKTYLVQVLNGEECLERSAGEITWGSKRGGLKCLGDVSVFFRILFLAIKLPPESRNGFLVRFFWIFGYLRK